RAEASRFRPDPVDVEMDVHAERKRASESTPNVSPDYPSGFIRAPLKYLRTVSEDEISEGLMSGEETKEEISDEITFTALPESPRKDEDSSDVVHEVIDLTAESDEDEMVALRPNDNEKISELESASVDEPKNREHISDEEMREQVRAEVMVELIKQFEEAIDLARRTKHEDELRALDEIQRLTVEIVELKSFVTNISSENAHLNDLLTKKDDDIKRLEAGNRTVRGEAEMLRFASQKPCSRCSSLEEKLNQSIDDYENLRSTLNTLQSEQSDTQVREECLKKSAEIELLRRNVVDLMQQANASLKQAETNHQGDIDQLEGEIEFYRNQYKKLVEKSDEKENKLLVELFELRRLSATECSSCPTLRDEIQMLGQKVTKLGLEKSQEAQSSEMAKQRVLTLEMQARTQTVEMEKLQDEMTLLQSQLASSKTSLESYEEKVKNFGEYEAFVQRELSSRQANYDQLMRLYSSESVNHRETKAKLHELQQELFRLRGQVPSTNVPPSETLSEKSSMWPSHPSYEMPEKKISPAPVEHTPKGNPFVEMMKGHESQNYDFAHLSHISARPTMTETRKAPTSFPVPESREDKRRPSGRNPPSGGGSDGGDDGGNDPFGNDGRGFRPDSGSHFSASRRKMDSMKLAPELTRTDNLSLKCFLMEFERLREDFMLSDSDVIGLFSYRIRKSGVAEIENWWARRARSQHDTNWDVVRNAFWQEFIYETSKKQVDELRHGTARKDGESIRMFASRLMLIGESNEMSDYLMVKIFKEQINDVTAYNFLKLARPEPRTVQACINLLDAYEIDTRSTDYRGSEDEGTSRTKRVSKSSSPPKSETDMA
ncbi:unnamed protein product, partial [Aphanomyces euteiches]